MQMPITCRDTKVNAIVETLVYCDVLYNMVPAYDQVRGIDNTLYFHAIATRTLYQIFSIMYSPTQHFMLLHVDYTSLRQAAGVVWYLSLPTSPDKWRRRSSFPIKQLQFFADEVALEVLILCQLKRIRTC